MDKNKELDYIREFCGESCFDDELSRDQLRCLWTAFCFHHNLDVDTLQYDLALQDVWNTICLAGDGTSEWEDVDGFENFMCRYMV